MASFDDKAKELKKKLSYCVYSVTRHNVTDGWYRMNVDMNYASDEPVDVVKVEYDAECYAMPNYCTLRHFMTTTIDELEDEFAI